MLYIIANTESELIGNLLNEIDNKNVVLIPYVRPKSIVDKIRKRVSYLFYLLNFSSPFFFTKEVRNKIRSIGESDKILLWDFTSQLLLLNISRKFRNIQKFDFLWNKIELKPEEFLKLKNRFKKIEFLTFDEGDAEEYSIKLLEQVCYDLNLYNFESNDCQSSDLYFVGNDKGRYGKLLSILDDCQNNNIKCDFTVCDKIQDPRIQHSYISFIENIKHIKKTKCILELVKTDQKGLTLRALEAVMANKKLITNNKSIKKYSFYSKENIFILGEDSNLFDFVSNENNLCYKFDYKKYCINNWLKYFI